MVVLSPGLPLLLLVLPGHCVPGNYGGEQKSQKILGQHKSCFCSLEEDVKSLKHIQEKKTSGFLLPTFTLHHSERLSTSYHRLLTAIVPAEKSAEHPLAPPQHHDDSHLLFLSRCVAQHLPGGMPLKLFTFVIVGPDTFLDVILHFWASVESTASSSQNC